MNKITAFDVLKEMGKRNMKTLKGFGLSNVTYITDGKKGGRITIAVDSETAQTLMCQKPIRFMLVVANDEDYKRIEKELEAQRERK